MVTNFCIMKCFRCKQSHSEWFDVKCTILEKPESDLFTVVVIGTSGPKSLMPLKAPSQKSY